jgi:hypothetical protein
VGEDVEAERRGLEAQGGALVGDDGVEFGDIDFDDVAGVGADEDVPRAGVAEDELIVGLVAVDEDALDDAGVGEEFEGAVDGGLADAEAVGLDADQDLVGLEEAFELHHDVEDVGAFGRVLEALGLEGAAEDGADGLDDVEGCGG